LHLRNITWNVRRAIPVAAVLLAASTAGAQQYVLTQPGATRATVVQPTTYVTRPATRPVTYVTQPAAQPVTYAAQPAAAQPAATQAVAAPAGDPYGFVNWLNATRAQYGLRAVGYDQNLTNWAAQNNAQQNARGLGHFVMGPARRQNSAMGNYASIGSMWMASSAHRAALLDPTISFVGIAGAGAYWTFNAR
jgi:uncharacterized protein YkwD